jgi:hypothetical protein
VKNTWNTIRPAGLCGQPGFEVNFGDLNISILQNNFENGMPSPIQPMYLGQSVGFVEEALNPGLGRVRLFLRELW